MNLFSLKKTMPVMGIAVGLLGVSGPISFAAKTPLPLQAETAAVKTKAQAVNFTVEWPIFGPKQVERFVKPNAEAAATGAPAAAAVDASEKAPADVSAPLLANLKPAAAPVAVAPQPVVVAAAPAPAPVNEKTVSAPAEPDANKAAVAQSDATKAVPVKAKADAPANFKKEIEAKATAYSGSAEENGGYAGMDAMGNKLELGTIAVDPRVIPLGSTVYVTGYNHNGLPVKGMTFKATDTGGAIKGNRIDIFLPGSNDQISSFGIQNVKIYVL